MSRFLSVLTLALAACGLPAYVQPAANEPHAILKIRHIVHAARGPRYGARTTLGEFEIDERTLGGQSGGDEPGTIHLRVRPEPARFGVRGHSFHYEQQMQRRSRQVPETYSCPQQQCSYSGGSYGGRSCHTVYRTCTRYRTEYYTQMVTVPVVDDQCGRMFTLAPEVGHVYLVQFDYFGNGECSARCFEQRPGATGDFQLTSCPIPPAPAVASN